MRSIKFLILLFAVASCAQQDEYIAISGESFIYYGDTPLSHTLYEGSDLEYHYFGWSSGKSGGKWKIDKSQLQLTCEFPFNSAQESSFIKEIAVNRYEPWYCKNT